MPVARASPRAAKSTPRAAKSTPRAAKSTRSTKEKLELAMASVRRAEADATEANRQLGSAVKRNIAAYNYARDIADALKTASLGAKSLHDHAVRMRVVATRTLADTSDLFNVTLQAAKDASAAADSAYAYVSSTNETLERVTLYARDMEAAEAAAVDAVKKTEDKVRAKTARVERLARKAGIERCM